MKNLSNEIELLLKELQTPKSFFEMIGVERLEAKFHNKVLTDLLNPKGVHGQGSKFLHLFLEQLQQKLTITNTQHAYIIDGFLTNNPRDFFVQREKYIGKVDEQNVIGGSIDISLTNHASNTFISLEVKVDASEGVSQVARYVNYKKGNNLVFFLTLDGIASQSAVEGDYHPISFKEHIIEWVTNCCDQNTNPSYPLKSYLRSLEAIVHVQNYKSTISTLIRKSSEFHQKLEKKVFQFWCEDFPKVLNQKLNHHKQEFIINCSLGYGKAYNGFSVHHIENEHLRYYLVEKLLPEQLNQGIAFGEKFDWYLWRNAKGEIIDGNDQEKCPPKRKKALRSLALKSSFLKKHKSGDANNLAVYSEPILPLEHYFIALIDPKSTTNGYYQNFLETYANKIVNIVTELHRLYKDHNFEIE